MDIIILVNIYFNLELVVPGVDEVVYDVHVLLHYLLLLSCQLSCVVLKQINK